MRKKKYTKPQIDSIAIDRDISLILMSWNDDTTPPDDPFGAAQQSAPSANPFEQNSFNDTSKK
jgi:hypothetical protein